MRRIIEHATSNILELDADVRLTHYLRRKLGEQQFDLANGEDVKLTPASEGGWGLRLRTKRRVLSKSLNDLFRVGYNTTLCGMLLENETLAQQAEANTEEHFALGDFKNIVSDVVLDWQHAHNSSAHELLTEERIFAAMQGMLADGVSGVCGAAVSTTGPIAG